MLTLPITRPLAALIAICCLGTAATAAAQDTREAVITAEEADKAAHPPPETKTKPEIVLDYVQKFLQPKERGFFPFFDGVYAGGGFTLGAGYGWAYGDKSNFLIRGLYSIKNYKLIEAVTLSPGHMNGRLSLAGKVGWRDATDAPFYGLGMTSTLPDKADFSLEQTYVQGAASLRPTTWSLFQGGVGLDAYSIGPGGTGERSTEEAFTPETAPGLGTDPIYVHAEGTAAIDWRTSPGYSRSGGYYGATINHFTNTNGGLDFNRLDGEAIQHIPILRETWVISLRSKVQTTLGNDVNDTPYFLLPMLGSGTTLRGYRSWRFRDRHSLLTQGEFRWIPSRLGLDMAVFYDAGKVAPRLDDLSLKGMAHDWGFGVRFHGPAFTPLRIEIARGSEGMNFVFSGGAAF